MKERKKSGAWRRQDRSEEPADSRPLVLYVEDDPDNRNVMQLRLGDRFSLIVAGGDREACEAMRAHHEALSCILMDIELKGSVLNGVELAGLMTGRDIDVLLPDYARDLLPTDAPLLFVTAYGEEYDTATLKAAGGVCVVRKPVDFSELAEAMSAVLARAG